MTQPKEQTVFELTAEMKAAVEEIRKRRPDATWGCVDYAVRWGDGKVTPHFWIFVSDPSSSKSYRGETLAEALDQVQTRAQFDAEKRAELQKQLAELEAKS